MKQKDKDRLAAIAAKTKALEDKLMESADGTDSCKPSHFTEAKIDSFQSGLFFGHQSQAHKLRPVYPVPFQIKTPVAAKTTAPRPLCKEESLHRDKALLASIALRMREKEEQTSASNVTTASNKSQVECQPLCSKIEKAKAGPAAVSSYVPIAKPYSIDKTSRKAAQQDTVVGKMIRQLIHGK